MKMSSSIDSVPTEFYASLQASGLDNLLDFLAQKPDTELRLKNMQRDDPDLTTEEKLTLLRKKLESNPQAFLTQFGHYFQSSHLECFSLIRKHNEEVDFQLKQVEQLLKPAVKKTRAKNRRYEALQRLVDTTDYFTEEEMQRRNPILFEQLIGRYHTKEEREAFLFQSSKSSSSQPKSDSDVNGPASRPTPLTDMLIAHMSRGDGASGCSIRRTDQEDQVEAEREAEAEYAEDDGMDTDEEEDGGGGSTQRTADTEEAEGEEIEGEEKELLKEEFFTTMYRSFLEGKDADFDYTTVDDNPEYDCGETLDQDEEDKYFEAEEPEAQIDKEDNSNSASMKSNHASDMEEEDELDAYMKGIEMEVQKQKQFTGS